MKEIIPRLFIGSKADYEAIPPFEVTDYGVVHACGEHYYQRFELKGKPFYELKNHLFLHLFDSERPFLPVIMSKGVDFAQTYLDFGKKVIIHCSLGVSRSPTIALVIMKKSGLFKSDSLIDVIKEFKVKYPQYDPSQGALGYLSINWNKI